MVTIEKASKILYQFRVGISEGSVLRLLQQNSLKKAPRVDNGFSSVLSKYSYSVDEESLVNLLLKLGATEEEINATLSV